MLQRLLLARHAFAWSNRESIASCAVPGAGLTAEGVEQARRLGVELGQEDLALGAATRLLRTQETLALALDDRTLPSIVIPELDEIDFGGFDGGLLEAYRAWAASHAPSERPPGGGESRADAAARFARGLGVVLERAEETVLLVGHALMIRYVLDGTRGLVPAARMAPVDHATLHVLIRDEVAAAARLLERWREAPRFRDPSNEG